MANVVKIKRSNTAGNVPTLVDGQIAINQKDKKLFYLNESGVMQSFDLDGFVASKIRAILGVTTLSGTNTGDDTVVLDSPNTVITGTTANTILSSYFLPAKTFKLNDAIRVDLRMEKGGTNAGWTVRTYINSSVSLTGAQLLSTTTLSSGNLTAGIARIHTVKSQIFTYPASTSAITDNIAGGATTTIIYDNETSNVYFILAIQLNNALDVAGCDIINIKKG